jgi:hypothetical protein
MSKNSWSLFLAILIAGSIFMGSVWAEEYAPRVNPPKNITNRDFWVKTISGWKIPSKEDVGIPAYPGALIVNFRDTSSMTSNGKELVTLPIIVLETEDEQTKVAAFFKEQLKDWKYENKFGMFDVFWMEGEFNFMDIDQAATQPNVQIQAPIASEPDRMMPTSKTRIQIIYKTQK